VVNAAGADSPTEVDTVNGNGEEIIDEITKGGLPSNVRVELVAESRRTCRECDWLAGDPAREDGSCLDYCVRHCPHQGQHAPVIHAPAPIFGVGGTPVGVFVPAPTCGQNYTHDRQVFPEKCSLPAGHKPRTSTANHFCFGIGWWA